MRSGMSMYWYIYMTFKYTLDPIIAIPFAMFLGDVVLFFNYLVNTDSNGRPLI